MGTSGSSLEINLNITADSLEENVEELIEDILFLLMKSSSAIFWKESQTKKTEERNKLYLQIEKPGLRIVAQLDEFPP